MSESRRSSIDDVIDNDIMNEVYEAVDTAQMEAPMERGLPSNSDSQTFSSSSSYSSVSDDGDTYDMDANETQEIQGMDLFQQGSNWGFPYHLIPLQLTGGNAENDLPGELDHLLVAVENGNQMLSHFSEDDNTHNRDTAETVQMQVPVFHYDFAESHHYTNDEFSHYPNVNQLPIGGEMSNSNIIDNEFINVTTDMEEYDFLADMGFHI